MVRTGRSAAERAKVLEDFKASGMSASSFARQEGIPKGTLYNWLSQVRHSATPLRVAKVVRKPESVMTPQSAAAIVIERGDVRIHVNPGANQETLRAVLDVLQEIR